MRGVSSRLLAASLLVTLTACAAPAPPARPAVSPAASPAPNAVVPRSCEGAFDSSFNVNVAPQVPVVPGGQRITLFYGTHTHGTLVRTDGLSFANYVGMLNAARSQLPDPTRSLFLGNGDDLAAVFCGVRTDGLHVIDAFNAASLDADTFGFNEVADDVSGIPATQVRALVAASRFTWVSANVLELDRSDVFAHAQGARRWIIRDVGGIKVGLTGLIVPEPAPGFRPASYGRDLTVIDPVAAARDVVPQMRASGAQLVIVLSHMDRETMERVARETNGIDAIVGSHIGLTAAYEVVNGVILSDGHDNMHAFAQLELVVKEGRLVAHAFGVRTATRSQQEDTAVTSVLSRYLANR